MMQALRTVLVGAGKVGMSYADDAAMARHYRYASHAQVLRDHPAFEWGAVVDVAPEALAVARGRWGVKIAATDLAQCAAYAPEVAVLATPPAERLRQIELLPSLRAVLVEKPLGRDEQEARRFVEECARRKIVVEVNLWRRADRRFRELAASLERHIGRVQAGFALYGNGLSNNGTHVVDFVRMLAGEIRFAQAVGETRPSHGPLPGDVHVDFVVGLASGAMVHVAPLDFREYRENAIDLWGESDRLGVFQEGLRITIAKRDANRAMGGEREIVTDAPEVVEPTVGDAFYEMYDDLAHAVLDGRPVCSPAESALRSTAVIDAVLTSSRRNGARVELG